MKITIKQVKVCGLECWIAINAYTGIEITRANSKNGCQSQVLKFLLTKVHN